VLTVLVTKVAVIAHSTAHVVHRVTVTIVRRIVMAVLALAQVLNSVTTVNLV